MNTGNQDVPNQEWLFNGIRDAVVTGIYSESADIPVWPMPEPTEAPAVAKKCECGSDAINAGTHSTWCNAYEPW